MTAESTASQVQAELVADLAGALCTRTLNQFAAESRLDGESLADALQRYEIDYAWHVLSSDRLRDQTLSLLEARLDRPASVVQKACIGGVLKDCAAGLSSELLMSFDNDVAEHLAARVFGLDARRALAEADALN